MKGTLFRICLGDKCETLDVSFPSYFVLLLVGFCFATAIAVVYWRKSPCGRRSSASRQAASLATRCARPGSGCHAAASSSSGQRSGALRPVPRWSTNTRSRRFASRAKRLASAPPSSIALCPGPPTKKNTGSAALSRANAGTIAK